MRRPAKKLADEVADETRALEKINWQAKEVNDFGAANNPFFAQF